MITDDRQLGIALHQLAGFKDMREAVRLHLSESEPSLVPLALEAYQQRILELQDEICHYLLRQCGGEKRSVEPSAAASV